MDSKENLSELGEMLSVKRLPTMWETWVRSLGREDPLEKEMATHEESGGLQSMGLQRVGHD